MTKLEIQAIRKMPSNYVQDGTLMCLTKQADKPAVVIMNPDLAPIVFNGKRFRKMKCEPVSKEESGGILRKWVPPLVSRRRK